MLSNLTTAGHNIPGLTDYPTLDAQQDRFLQLRGYEKDDNTKEQQYWKKVKACTMLQAYNDFIPLTEKERIKKLEIFDEIEEWELIMNHYSLTLATTGIDLLS